MKELTKAAILLLVGFGLGFMAPSALGIWMRKARNAVFLAESEAQLKSLRRKIADFQKARGRFPSGAAELVSAGLLDPGDPPCESLRRGCRWVAAFDGRGGFLYLSATGRVFLNIDLSREKFFSNDLERLKGGDLLPPGALY